jgi:4-hydroxy-3-methylbut-2-enyl diphosphate reductase
VKDIAPRSDLEIVIGAPNSSNSLRLVEVAERCGTPAHMIQRAAEIDPSWLEGVSTLGITAGASAPEALVDEVLARLRELRNVSAEEVVTARERITFKLPRQLVD